MQTKKSFLTIITFLLAATIYSQDSNDIIVVDEIAGNMTQLKEQYGEASNAYFLEGIEKLAPEQIANVLEKHQGVDLHIYVLTKPGAIVFSSVALTPDNVRDFTDVLKAWKGHIAGSVLIHSEIVFTTGKGIELKRELEDITGLTFTMR